MRGSRRRLEFRIVLGILLVWSAWPAVADALDTDAGRSTNAVAAAPPPTSSTTAVVPTTVSISTTVTVPLPSTATSAPPPTTEPPVTAPPDTVPAPPQMDPPLSSQAPPPAEAPAVAVASSPSVSDAAVGDIVQAMNRDRAGNGIAPLCANARLTAIAQAWADHLAQTGTFEHQDLWSVVGTTPFRGMAENLLRGSASLTPDTMEAAWMASPGHRVHILDPAYVAARCGCRAGPTGVSTPSSSGGLLR